MKVELLAPAGSFTSMQAAVHAGADAVYLGGEKFGARAYADNFDRDQMIEAIDYAHMHGRKLYLTVNTLLKNKELERELYDYLAPYYDAGMDAVIVQDMGVLSFIREYFPGMHIHASTQMTITGVESAKLLKEAGASRIVTARELSLKEIKKIYDETHMEIESFIHGALCYCYSGQCLMSSLIGGRSGNRGRCAQPCRLPYEVYRNGKRLNDDKSGYPLSPKDMCTVELLPSIIDAGVRSLKIEGRMKKPEYTAGVVSVYRKYLDLYLSGKPADHVSREDYQELMDLYNRDGFHQSYYNMRNGRSMMALRNEKQEPSADKKKRNEELFARIRKDYVETPLKEEARGNLSLFEGCPAVLTIDHGPFHVTVEGDTVQEASRRPMDEAQIRKQMMKTGDTQFVFKKLEIYMGDNIFIPVSCLNELRRKAFSMLRDEILAPEHRNNRKAKEHMKVSENRPVEDNLVLSASVCKKEQLDALLNVKDVEIIYADCGIFPAEGFRQHVIQAVKEAQDHGKKLFLMLPHIVRDGDLNGREEYFADLIKNGLSGFLVRNLESYGILKREGLETYAVLDANMYTMNEGSQEFWYRKDIMWDTVPLELNHKELAHRDNKNSEMILYGYAPMMVSVQCVQKNLDRCNHGFETLTIKDRYQKEFHAVCNCEFCYNTIYNALPLSLINESSRIRQLGINKMRMAFTMENGRQTEEIAESFVAVYKYGQQASGRITSMESTRGHFGRGVE